MSTPRFQWSWEWFDLILLSIHFNMLILVSSRVQLVIVDIVTALPAPFHMVMEHLTSPLVSVQELIYCCISGLPMLPPSYTIDCNIKPKDSGSVSKWNPRRGHVQHWYGSVHYNPNHLELWWIHSSAPINSSTIQHLLHEWWGVWALEMCKESSIISYPWPPMHNWN